MMNKLDEKINGTILPTGQDIMAVLGREMDPVRPLSDEIALLEKLGLAPWECRVFEEKEIGTVKLGDSTCIAIAVRAMPALFWRFNILKPSSTGEGVEHLLVETGSVQLSEVWPSVVLVAQGVLSVRQIA